MMGKRSNKNNGFTLAELLIVVAIIAVLVAVSIPVFKWNIEKAKEAYDLYTMRQAASAAVELFYAGVSDQTSANEAGLSWWSPGDNSATNANAWGIYDPDTGKFYSCDVKYVKPYGKGTTTDGETSFVMGNDRGAYASKKDYTKAFVMIAIYPNGNNKHVDIYWKDTDNKYIGGQHAASDPKYSIRIGL